MPRKKNTKLREQDVGGLKHLEKLLPLLDRLHDVGRERDNAGNRELHFDQYCRLVLLYLRNPTITSLRGIQQAGEPQMVQRLLGCPGAALGSLSEAATVFDPARLKDIIAEPGGPVGAAQSRSPTEIRLLALLLLSDHRAVGLAREAGIAA